MCLHLRFQFFYISRVACFSIELRPKTQRKQVFPRIYHLVNSFPLNPYFMATYLFKKVIDFLLHESSFISSRRSHIFSTTSLSFDQIAFCYIRTYLINIENSLMEYRNGEIRWPFFNGFTPPNLGILMHTGVFI